jgi:radical SAM protein with 4Fe4S-binding SPASM domain
MRVFNITFSGGEPTLRKDLEELISYTSDQSLKPVLITNGALLDEKKIENLIAAGLQGIQISLDGATAEVHDHFRGLPGLFDHLMEIIPEIVESPLELQVAYTITKANMHHVTNVMELADKLHMGRLAIMNVLNTGRMKEHGEYLPTLNDYVTVLNQMIQKEKELENTFIFYPEVPSKVFKAVLGERSYSDLISTGKIGPCVAGITQCAVNPDGSVIPCDASMGISVGNVREQPLAEIWRTSPVLKHLRAISKSKQDPCNKCPEQTICIAGCNALPWQLENDEYRFTADIMCSQCFSQFQG